MSQIRPSSVEEYIKAAPAPAREKLEQMRSILKEVAPNATEEIKYGHPVFVDGRILFAYSAHKSHMNFLTTGHAMQPFMEELKEFKTGKDSIQITYDKPFPEKIIRKIAEYRIRHIKESC